MTHTQPRGWWAEHDTDPDSNPFAPKAPWRATLQLDAGCFSLDGIAFHNEADCLAFIRTEIIGRGSIEEERP